MGYDTWDIAKRDPVPWHQLQTVPSRQQRPSTSHWGGNGNSRTIADDDSFDKVVGATSSGKDGLASLTYFGARVGNPRAVFNPSADYRHPGKERSGPKSQDLRPRTTPSNTRRITELARPRSRRQKFGHTQGEQAARQEPRGMPSATTDPYLAATTTVSSGPGIEIDEDELAEFAPSPGTSGTLPPVISTSATNTVRGVATMPQSAPVFRHGRDPSHPFGSRYSPTPGHKPDSEPLTCDPAPMA